MTQNEPTLGRQKFPLNDETIDVITTSMSEFVEGRSMTYADIAEALDVARALNADQSTDKYEYLQEQFTDFMTVASWMPGYVGVFGTGYPFYANRPNRTVVAVEEIDRFVGSVQDKAVVEAASATSISDIGSWLCSVCQVENELPDLKVKCNPCGLSSVKPREVFKALPDLDFWVILDEVSPKREAQLEQYLGRAGFYSSDTDIYFAIKDATEVGRAIVEGRSPRKRLPIDLHITTSDQLVAALTGVETVVKDVYRPGIVTGDEMVPISPRSLHVTWETSDEPYDFFKDYLISLTTRGTIEDIRVKKALAHARIVVQECLSDQDRLDLVRMHPKEARQFENRELQELLVRRWAVAE